MVCSMEKLLYFQGSRFSLGFLCHFSEWSHEACFSCVYDTTGVGYVLQRLLHCPDPGRGKWS